MSRRHETATATPRARWRRFFVGMALYAVLVVIQSLTMTTASRPRRAATSAP